MTVKGLENVVGRLKLTLKEIKEDKTVAVIDDMLKMGMLYAKDLTPRDNGFLVNSADKFIWPSNQGYAGAVFYGASYAAAVNSASGKLKGQPREDFGRTRVNSFFGPLNSKSFGGGTGKGRYWDPHAEPHFLEKGMQAMIETDKDIILEKHYSV